MVRYRAWFPEVIAWYLGELASWYPRPVTVLSLFETPFPLLSPHLEFLQSPRKLEIDS